MFKRLSGANEARDLLLGRCMPVLHRETLPIEAAAGRVLSEEIVSGSDLPGFNRAAMDGFAVRARDTRGAGQQAPVYLDQERAVPIRTGLQVPEGFDAVVMLEDAVKRDDLIEIAAEVHPFRNVSRMGEDVSKGQVVFLGGHRLRPPDLALLAALGIESISVYRRPEVVIIPTGGELVTPGSRELKVGEAYEVNGLISKLYVEMWGGVSKSRPIVPDDPGLIEKAIKSGSGSDMMLILGGTSVGEKDFAPKALEKSGELLVHGMRLTPGKPTAIGSIGETVVVCLPGYPVAALSALYLLVRPAIKKMAHLCDPVPSIRAVLSRKIASKVGYQSFVRVVLKDGVVTPIMTSGAGILSSVAKADGFVMVPEDLEGIEAGETVDVSLFE